jgi:hypothetical protein
MEHCVVVFGADELAEMAPYRGSKFLLLRQGSFRSTLFSTSARGRTNRHQTAE